MTQYTLSSSLMQDARMADLRRVADDVLRQYDIKPLRVARAAESFNTVFRVTTASGAFALRIGATLSIHAEGTLAVETAWLRRMSDDGLSAPRIHANRRGQFGTEVYDGQSRGRTCSLFDWVAGRSLRGRLTAPTATALGRLAAQLHANAESWSPTGLTDAMAARDVLYWRIPVRLSEPDLPWHSVFIDALDKCQALLDQLWQVPPRPPHLLHGDLTPANVVVSGGQLVPIDFQDLIVGCDIQDLAITVAALRRFAAAPRLVESFRTGYEALRPWPDVDPVLFEGLLAARVLNQINLTLNLREAAGLTDYLSVRAQRLSRWLDSGRLPS